MTSMGMNWLQKGRTLSSAPKAWYFATTSGRACPFTRQRGNLNTGTPSFSASRPVGQQVRNGPSLQALTHSHRGLPRKVAPASCPQPVPPGLPQAQRDSPRPHRADGTQGTAPRGRHAGDGTQGTVHWGEDPGESTQGMAGRGRHPGTAPRGPLCVHWLQLTTKTSELTPHPDFAPHPPPSAALWCCPQVTVKGCW